MIKDGRNTNQNYRKNPHRTQIGHSQKLDKHSTDGREWRKGIHLPGAGNMC